MRTFFVYIMSNKAGITYVGVTNDIFRRVEEHKRGVLPGFSRREKTYRLVYYEEFAYVEDAILREKQIKLAQGEKRKLIVSANPKWEDLSEAWFMD